MTSHNVLNQQLKCKSELNECNSPIKVMIVDNKKTLLDIVATLLTTFSFEVSTCESGSDALKALVKGKEKFDFVLINSELDDVNAHVFLRMTRTMEHKTILISEQDDDETVERALMDGAYYVFKWPLTFEDIRILRTDAIKLRVQKHNDNTNGTNKFIPIPDNFAINPTVTSTSTSAVKKEPLVFKEEQKLVENRNERGRAGIIWTPELHEKFMEAVRQLGDGLCLPKFIHELMNEPSITREQVASHLQYCRNGKWKSEKTERD